MREASAPATGVGITGHKVYMPGCQLLGEAGRFLFPPNLVYVSGVHGYNSLANFKLVQPANRWSRQGCLTGGGLALLRESMHVGIHMMSTCISLLLRTNPARLLCKSTEEGIRHTKGCTGS